MSGRSNLCFLTPSIFFRIVPILRAAPQVKQPGTVSRTIFSAAAAVRAGPAINKNTSIIVVAVFFIITCTPFSGNKLRMPESRTAVVAR